jgi:serine/threonine protein phosphatase PrpC
VSDVHVFIDADMEQGEDLELPGAVASVFSARRPGRQGRNEDAAGLVCFGTSLVAVLSDGAGGHPGGAEAAELAVRTVCEKVAAVGSAGDGVRPAILDGFESANRAIVAMGTGAAATLAVVEIEGRTARSYHAGDSMVLVTGQRGRRKWLNVPHSPVGYAVEAGLLDRGDALHHEDLHLVSNILGSEDMRIELGGKVRLAPRDTIIVASDGLSDNLHLDEIVEIVRKGPLSRAVGGLAELSRDRMVTPSNGAPSKPDDMTVIAIRPRK